MKLMTTTPQENIQNELKRRHRVAAMIVGALLGLTLVLVGIAFLAGESLYRPWDPTLPWILWITILVFGMGAFVLRRARFSAMRLQDIAALRGLSSLLKTLQGTTIQLAFLGGAIALLGFIVTILTGNKFDMLRAGGVAVIVLLYCYPQRGAWQRLVQGIERKGLVTAEPSVKGNIT
ncbi:MAG: hypothetical protein H7Y30_01040 [Pyrinomonadaceae bacterium]|nr:hypothetical protein [Pyrinomonadaceae bacterium]